MQVNDFPLVAAATLPNDRRSTVETKSCMGMPCGRRNMKNVSLQAQSCSKDSDFQDFPA